MPACALPFSVQPVFGHGAQHGPRVWGRGILFARCSALTFVVLLEERLAQHLGLGLPRNITMAQPTTNPILKPFPPSPPPFCAPTGRRRRTLSTRTCKRSSRSTASSSSLSRPPRPSLARSGSDEAVLGLFLYTTGRGGVGGGLICSALYYPEGVIPSFAVRPPVRTKSGEGFSLASLQFLVFTSLGSLCGCCPKQKRGHHTTL